MLPAEHLARLKSVSGGNVRDVGRLYSVTGGVAQLELGDEPVRANVMRVSFPRQDMPFSEFLIDGEEYRNFGTNTSSTGPSIPSALRADPSSPALLTAVSISVGDSRTQVAINTSDGIAPGNQDGPDLSDAWERNDTAITIRFADRDITLGGPASSLASFIDPSEQYGYVVPALSAADRTAVENITATTQWELILTDGPVPPRGS